MVDVYVVCILYNVYTVNMVQFEISLVINLSTMLTAEMIENKVVKRAIHLYIRYIYIVTQTHSVKTSYVSDKIKLLQFSCHDKIWDLSYELII